jgi:hypothetical protein
MSSYPKIEQLFNATIEDCYNYLLDKADNSTKASIENLKETIKNIGGLVDEKDDDKSDDKEDEDEEEKEKGENKNDEEEKKVEDKKNGDE